MIDLSQQLNHAIYVPALFPPYAQFAVEAPGSVRSLPGGLTPGDLDFFRKDGSLFHLPAALYSAGLISNLDDPPTCMVTERDRPNTLVIGDSGGYQIISGNFEVHDDSDRRSILGWINSHCDFAMTLDIPTIATEKENSLYSFFDQCLKGTLTHLDFFQRHHDQRQVWLLNVLQGNDEEQADEWYEAVKDYDFDGWAFAGPMKRNIHYVVRRLLRMLREEKIGGKRCWIHFLGIGDLTTACLLTTIRDCLRRRLGDDGFHISFDTSSPLLVAGKYRTIYAEARISYEKFGFISEELPINDPAWLGSTEPLPYQSSPIAAHLTKGDIIVDGAIHADSRWDAASSMMLMNHNVYVQMDGIFRANAAYAQPEAKAQYNVPKKLILAKKAIAEIFEARIPHGKLVAHRELLESV